MGNGIPEEYVKVLSRCQDSLSPVPFDELLRVLKEDFNATTSDLFLEVDQEPVGCASLAQVHRAVLKNGDEVAVKIQYPTVARKTQVDLRNIDYAARLCEFIFPRFQFSVSFLSYHDCSGLFPNCESLSRMNSTSYWSAITCTTPTTSSNPILVFISLVCTLSCAVNAWS